MTRGRMQLLDGNARAAFQTASRLIEKFEKLQTVATDINGTGTKQNVLRGQYGTAAAAALLLGNYAQAEAFARKRLATPLDGNSDADPLEDVSANKSVIAHSLALQGRGAEALKLLEPGLAYYRREQKANAHGSSFRYDLAYALYASALAHGNDPAQRSKRDAELAEAKTVLEGTSAEIQRLAEYRQLATMIASARAS